MDLYPLFDWLELTPIGVTIRESIWMFAGIEAVHLLALATLGGAALILDFTVLGVGLKGIPVSAVERSARPWLLGALAVLIVTGVALALSEALKLYGKPAFWIKMVALVLALAFTFAIRNPLAARDRLTGAGGKAIALVSLGLWLTVAGAGRWIGFS